MPRILTLLALGICLAWAESVSNRLPSIDEIYGDNLKRTFSEGVKKVNPSRSNPPEGGNRAPVSPKNTEYRTNSEKEEKLMENIQVSAGHRVAEYTFMDINLLSEDMVLRGINPSYDFYVPIYRNLKKVRISLRIFLPEYLRKDSSVSILVNDIPRYSLSMQDSGKPVYIDIYPERGRDFAKISIRGNLRLSNNVCEDVFSDRPYLILSADSTLNLVYSPAEDINTFLMDYGRHFCIEDKRLLLLVYYLSKIRTIPPVFEWGTKEGCEKVIALSSGKTRLEGNTLHISQKTLQALLVGYRPFIFGKSLSVQQVVEREKNKDNTIYLRDLSVRTSTVKGMSNLSFYIPFSTAVFGGMPDTLYLMLNFSHTPAHQKDHMELRVYLNDALIQSIPLEGYGRRSLNIKIPTQELSYGQNSLVINLVNFTSSDSCFGATTQSALTVFDDSYFYWNSVSRDVSTISDFLRIINRDVGVLVEEERMLPFAVHFLSMLARINRSIENIELVEGTNSRKYDFLIRFGKKASGGELFEVYDPISAKVIFSAMYSEPFMFAMLEKKAVPELVFLSYGNPDTRQLSTMYDIRDYTNLFGNIAVISDSYFASFDTLQKLRMRYEGQKGIGYYWNKYRLLILLILAVPVFYLLIYTYRRLTGRNI